MGKNYPYQDSSLPPEARAEDLLGRMSLEEKLAQTQCYSVVNAMGTPIREAFPYGVGHVSSLVALGPENEQGVAAMIRAQQEEIMAASRFGIPALFHIETLCGVMASGATVFGGGIAQASTWDTALQKQVGQMIARQGKAVGFRQAFAPVLDLCRNPRFGRMGETYGEDPTLAAAMGTAYVQGIQQDGKLDEGMGATAKHFLGFMAGEAGIHSAREPIPYRELREVYGKSFQAAITDGAISSVMNSYGTLDGEAICTSKDILTGLLREEMKFDGFVAADYSAVSNVYRVQKQAESMTDAGQMAIEAGLDCEMPYRECFNEELLERFRNGKADQEALDRAVRNVLVLKFRLGLFEQPFPEEERLAEVYHTEEAERLAGTLAREAMILLKNEKEALPLNAKGKKIAVIGYHGSSLICMFGGYMGMAMKENQLGLVSTMAGISPTGEEKEAAPGMGIPQSMLPKKTTYPGSLVRREHEGVTDLVRQTYPEMKSLIECLAEACPEAEIRYAFGYPYAGTDESGFDEALELAAWADIVICTLGGRYGWNDASTTGEEIGAMNINLPVCQERFLRKLQALRQNESQNGDKQSSRSQNGQGINSQGKNGEGQKSKTIIGVHIDGRPCSSDAADEVCDALLECWAVGTHGPEAITDILLGQYNPSGHLPVSIAVNAGQTPVYYAHEYNSGYDHTTGNYEGYYDGPHRPRYVFGHGLSYTTFRVSDLILSAEDLMPTDLLQATVTVENTGTRPGAEVVQLYFKDLAASIGRPVMELEGFARVELAPGERKQIRFTLPVTQLAFLDREKRWKVEAGQMEALVGTSSEAIADRKSFRITESAWTEGATRGFVAKSEIL